MENKYNVWCKWHPLKVVMLGRCYQPDFFKDIKNTRIRSALMRIAEETLEDLEGYEKVLLDFGCKVIRPGINTNASILDYANVNGFVSGEQGIPRAPLQPRDKQLVIGNDLYFTGIDANGVFESYLQRYNGLEMVQWHINPKTKMRMQCVDAPSITVVGKDIYVDQIDVPLYQYQIDLLLENIPDARINILNIGGHSDGCFHTLKPGAILSLLDIQNYEKTFPGWDVCFLPNQSWSLLDGFLSMKHKVGGRWWVPGEEDNDEFTYFVETWLHDWVGFCEESVFDVNVLMLDEHHVCVNNYNEIAFEFFRNHKIEPIIVPWRHRYFWDGGLHCITLDLYREGEQEDYFPDRQGPIVDLGMN